MNNVKHEKFSQIFCLPCTANENNLFILLARKKKCPHEFHFYVLKMTEPYHYDAASFKTLLTT